MVAKVSSSASQRLIVSAAPPRNRTASPCLANLLEPATLASRYAAPRSASACLCASISPGSPVVVSRIRCCAVTAWPSARTTSAATALLGSESRRVSHRPANSTALPHMVRPPSSATAGSCPNTSQPCPASRWPSAPPSSPTPMMPTRLDMPPIVSANP